MAGYTFDQYVYGLTSFIQNEHQEADVAEPRAAKVMSAQTPRTLSLGAGAAAGAGAGADKPRPPLRCFRCKKKGHKIADCTAASDSNDDDEVLTPADLKAIKVFLRGAAATSLAESKAAVAPKVSASMARVHLPLVSDDDDGEDDE
jgi:hypothetical protein